MLETLRAHDPEMVELTYGAGSVLLPPSLAGRIFCQWQGELLHRLDGPALKNPLQGEYNNYGGNSLWPAPEGGAFAFNYGAGGDAWVVQDGIATDVPTIERTGEHTALIAKTIALDNRKGVSVRINYRRIVQIQPVPVPLGQYRIDGMAYSTVDSFAPLGDYGASEVLIAPWSLEQFPGAEGIVAFGKLDGPSPRLNYDFYSDPTDRIILADDQFIFALGGPVRHQIGIPVASRPSLIGALDFERNLLFIRKTPAQDGLYFNIADNDQSAGPFSAADLYSVFNGGDLGFFELETIGAMQSEAGRILPSSLHSETVILHGPVEELIRYLRRETGVDLIGPR
jgi:hypothetical protein